jgi:hypothetical protein
MTSVPNSLYIALEEEQDRAVQAETECRLLMSLNSDLEKQLKVLQEDLAKAIIPKNTIANNPYVWVYSCREDNFTFSDDFSTKEEAFKFAIHELGLVAGDTVYVGQKCPAEASDFIYSDQVLDQMREHSYEDLGDYAEGWLSDLTEDQKGDLAYHLHTAVDAWADKHKKQPEFFSVINIEHMIYDPEEDEEHQQR